MTARILIIAAVLSLCFTAPAIADWTPSPPAPLPPNATSHTVIDPPGSSFHMGNAENWLANSSGAFFDFVSRYGVTYDGTTAWTGSWDTRPDKPVPGEQRAIHTVITWYRTDTRVACEYSAEVIGTDSNILGTQDGLVHVNLTHCGPYGSIW